MISPGRPKMVALRLRALLIAYNDVRPGAKVRQRTPVREGFELTRIKYGDEVVGKCMWVAVDDIRFCFAYLDPGMDAEEYKQILRPRQEED